MHDCEKRDFYTNKTLTERVRRLEETLFAPKRPDKTFEFEEVNQVPDPDEVYRDVVARCKATTPIDLLREFRAEFEAEARCHRERASRTPDRVEEQVCGAKAFAAEQAVKKIDATLRDWA